MGVCDVTLKTGLIIGDILGIANLDGWYDALAWIGIENRAVAQTSFGRVDLTAIEDRSFANAG